MDSLGKRIGDGVGLKLGACASDSGGELKRRWGGGDAYSATQRSESAADDLLESQDLTERLI